MATPNVSNVHGEHDAALANAQGRLLAASFAQRLTPATAGLNRLEGELERLSEDERIGFASMVEYLPLEACRTTDVQALAERVNGRSLSIVAARGAGG
jgi:hypothetical protein